jgi:hypothetical protein
MRFWEKYKLYTQNRKNLGLLAVSVLLWIIGVLATYFAIIFATERASQPVTDIILSNIRVFDVNGLFLYGPVLFWVIIGAYLVFFEPRKIPFSLKSIALFLIIRSAFLTMTHIGPFPSHAMINKTGIIGVFTSGSDLFFSSHTGMPFLMALILWDNKYLRLFSIFASLFFGAVVLLAHLHYSIDVFAAFFITYSIFHIADKFFKKERLLFEGG